MTDRFGLGWRPELALDLHRHGDRVEVLEFLAEEWFDAPRDRLATLAAWCRERPAHLHGTTLGLASAAPIAPPRLAAWRRLLDAAQPERWSEHLAFVRGGGVELGHLAAPPRSAATIAGALDNLARIRAAVGSLPLVENVATLITPPGSDRDEPAWLSAIVEGSGAGLLLDLHNLHANAANQGWDALAALARLPVAQVAAVHLAGGRRWRGRVLDDHLHPVPDAVFTLLEELAARVPGPLDVIIERDGSFPPFAELLAELDHARASVAAGRARRIRPHGCGALAATLLEPAAAGAIPLEAFLARLYTDPALRAGFLADPGAVARAAGLGEDDARQLAVLDRDGLALTADSLAAKRRGAQEH
jgi:uncharacterized protein (UPF0276 family)